MVLYLYLGFLFCPFINFVTLPLMTYKGSRKVYDILILMLLSYLKLAVFKPVQRYVYASGPANFV